MELADLRNRFDYHPPEDDETKERHARVRSLCVTLAEDLNELAPDCREKSVAITHLEDTMMWMNAAIARHDEDGNRR